MLDAKGLQALIDRTAARQQPAAHNPLTDPPHREGTLVLPNPPWRGAPRGPGWQPPDTPFPESDGEPYIRTHAALLTAQFLGSAPPDLITAAANARRAEVAARQEVAALAAQYATVSAQPSAEATLEQTAEQTSQRTAIAALLDPKRARVEALSERTGAAITEVRWVTEVRSSWALQNAERMQIRQMREEAERLLKEAGWREVALDRAISQVRAWTPPEE